MYKDMIDHISGNRFCKMCKGITRHSLVEYVEIDETVNLVEVIDSWFQCQKCGQTKAILRGTGDLPF